MIGLLLNTDTMRKLQIDAWDIVGRFKDHSVLVKPNADGDALRILPPLCITRDQIDECMAHIEQALLSYCGKAS